nr:AMP-binding protein [Sphingomonas sp. Y57]
MRESWRRLMLDELLARAARQAPETIAFRCGAVARSYAAAEDRVRRLANALHDRGVRRGDRVAVMMQNSIETVEAYLGVVRAGAICVPVNFRFVAAEVAQLVADAEPAFVICDEATRDMARGGGDDRLIVATDQVGAGVRLEDIIASAPADPIELERDESDIAFMMYTSGTTGRPKGALLSHLNLIANTMNMFAALEIGASDRNWLAGLPLFHIAGLSGLLPFLYVGGTSTILSSTAFDAAAVADVMERDRITSCYFVPTQWQMICALPGVRERSFGLERVTWGASIAPRAVLDAIAETFPGARMYNVFGQTEMSPITCVLRADLYPDTHGSIGKAVPGVEMRLVDDGMNDVAPGQVGEIVYRGPNTFAGYWKLPEATADAFAGGWFHSGDLVQADPDGFLHVVDRKKDMIISGGENIYCPELEATIVSHPAVQEVAVIGMPHPKWVETPWAIVVLKPGEAAEAGDIVDWCRARLASYKKPSRVVFVEKLPRNASGKIVKPEIRRRYVEDQSPNG